jgi:hypothetical protein
MLIGNRDFQPHITFIIAIVAILFSIIAIYFLDLYFEIDKKIIIKGYLSSIFLITVVSVFKILSNYLSSREIGVNINSNKGNEFKELDCIYIRNYRQRLLSYHSAIQKNSRVNLLIGLLIASITVFFIGYFFLHDNVTPDKVEKEIIPYYYASRFFAILFINLLVVFFLRLYKQNLHDIKFFQNELSNIDSKLIALYYAKNEEDKKVYNFILEELGKTERNFILKNGETTIELEKMKLDKDENYSISELILQLSQKLKSGEDKSA